MLYKRRRVPKAGKYAPHTISVLKENGEEFKCHNLYLPLFMLTLTRLSLRLTSHYENYLVKTKVLNINEAIRYVNEGTFFKHFL